MKIQPISSNSFLSNIRQKNKNVQRSIVLPKENNDSFSIKYPEVTKFEDKITFFESDIENYAKNHEKIKISDIKELVKKYSPQTKVKKQSIFLYKQGGDINTPILMNKKDGIIELELLPKEMRLDFRKSKKVVLSSFIHEMCHIFQEESENRLSLIDFYSSELFKNPNNYNTVYFLYEIFEKTEDEILGITRCISQDALIWGSKHNKTKINLAKVFEKKGLDVKNVAGNVINKVITEYKKAIPDIDVNLALRFIEYKVKNEIEAYNYEINFCKKNSINKEMLELDTILKLYKEILKAIEVFKN